MTTLSRKTSEALRDAKWGSTYFPDPPFEELLEACSRHFPGDFMLSNEGEGPWGAYAKNKIGGVWLGEGDAQFEGHGPNPKEALANFWLALPEELRVK